MSTNYKADFPLLAQRDVASLDSAATAQRPAGDTFTRPGGPKALRLLGGEPLLVHAVRRVAAAPSVRTIVVAAPVCSLTLCRIVATPVAKSRFSHRSASTSPRRAPVTTTSRSAPPAITSS